MIARTAETTTTSIWSDIAAPLPPAAIQWRQDGRPVARDGKFSARFVAFVDAQFVRDRLDAVVPGEWDLTLDPLPSRVAFSGEEESEPYAFKARIQVLGVIRESVGQGKDYKTAETDAFKRAAVRFGIAAELYSFGPNWVPVDGDGKFAKPLEDPAVSYARRHGGNGAPSAARPALSSQNSDVRSTEGVVSQRSATSVSASADVPDCPSCSGPMYDNRATKKGNQPDFKCKDRSCAKAVWVEKKKPADDDSEIPH